MRLLLDTHALLWWLADDPALSVRARAAIAESDNPVFVSAASAWEITTKNRIGKLPGAALFSNRLGEIIAQEGFFELPISVAQAEKAGSLPGAHRDPFDRMLIAQAVAGGLTLVSNERLFDAFGVSRLW